MYSNLTILDYGISHAIENWLNVMNSVCFADRVYYILEEGAGYVLNGQKHPFRKNHLYILSHTLKLSYYLDSDRFHHAYITYSNFLSPKYADVVEIPLEKPSMLKSDVETFLHFFDGKPHFFHNKLTDAAFREHYDRMMLLLKSILYDVGHTAPQKDLTDPLIAKTMQYIHDHFAEEISVKTLANLVNLSPNQFARRFVDQTGLTPYQYLKQYRFDIALSMLNAGSSVSAVSEFCGFLSASAFSNSFKKNFGYPPSKIFT